jgi:thiamine transporter ThiT
MHNLRYMYVWVCTLHYNSMVRYIHRVTYIILYLRYSIEGGFNMYYSIVSEGLICIIA